MTTVDGARPVEDNACAYCNGTLSVPGIFSDYQGCPSCVLDGEGTFVTLPGFHLQEPDQIWHVYCCRCPWDEAFWFAADEDLVDSVEQHVGSHHLGAPGPSRPDGTPIWVEDTDWWVVTAEDLQTLRRFQAPGATTSPRGITACRKPRFQFLAASLRRRISCLLHTRPGG